MQTYSVLIVEDNQGDADFLQRSLRRAEGARFEVSVVGWLNSALTSVGAKHFDAVLLDLSLPDSQGLDTVVSFIQAAPEVPVIVMTGYDDMQTGINAVRYGAQDYMIKGDTTVRPLERAIVYAIERKRADLVGKKLLAASIGNISSPGMTNSLNLVHEHLASVADFVHDLRAYIAQNAPAHRDNIESIAGRHQLDIVLREIRFIVQMDTDPPPAHTTRPGMKRSAKVSDMALRTVENLSRSTHVPAPVAKDALLDVIRSSDEIGQRYGGSEE